MIFYLIFEKINMPDWSITLMLGAQESYLKIQSIYLAAAHTSLPFFIPSLFPKFWLFSEWKLYILVKRHNILMKMKKIKATKSYCAVSLSRLLLSQTPRVKRNTLLQPSQVLFWKQEAVEAAAGQADAPDADNDGFRIYSKIGRNYILDVL